MVFEFPRRDTSSLFFPTVHVHDGKVHATAGFDHALYCQVPSKIPHRRHENEVWEASMTTAEALPRDTGVWLEREQKAFRLKLTGPHPNRDVVVDCQSVRSRNRCSASVRRSGGSRATSSFLLGAR
jgi:hypothetical protein